MEANAPEVSIPITYNYYIDDTDLGTLAPEFIAIDNGDTLNSFFWSFKSAPAGSTFEGLSEVTDEITKHATQGQAPTYSFAPDLPGRYVVKVQAQNTTGLLSDWESTAVTVYENKGLFLSFEGMDGSTDDNVFWLPTIADTPLPLAVDSDSDAISGPSGIALYSDGFYVADTDNERLLEANAIFDDDWITYGDSTETGAADVDTAGHYNQPIDLLS